MLIDNIKNEGLYCLFDETVEKTIRTKRFYIDDLYDYIRMINSNRYFRDIEIRNGLPDDGALGFYSYSERKVVLYLQAITAIKINEFSKQNPEVAVPMVYFDLMFKLIHEIEHSKQYALLFSKANNSLEKRLLEHTMINDNQYFNNLAYVLLTRDGIVPSMSNIEMKSYELRNLWYNFYKENYDAVTFERLADINSFIFLENIFKDSKKYRMLFDYANVSRFVRASKGYTLQKTGIISPTISFMEMLKQYGLIPDIDFDWYSTDSSETLINLMDRYKATFRLKYGLPLSFNEFYTLINKCKDKSENFEKQYKIELR